MSNRLKTQRPRLPSEWSTFKWVSKQVLPLRLLACAPCATPFQQPALCSPALALIRSLWDTCGWATPFVVLVVAFLLLGKLQKLPLLNCSGEPVQALQTWQPTARVVKMHRGATLNGLPLPLAGVKEIGLTIEEPFRWGQSCDCACITLCALRVFTRLHCHCQPAARAAF